MQKPKYLFWQVGNTDDYCNLALHHMWMTRYLKQHFLNIFLFCFGKTDADSNKSFVWPPLLMQVLAFAYVASGFWEYCTTVWSMENTALLANTYVVSTYSSVDAQNSCASDESLLLFFEVFGFPFPLNWSCQILFFEDSVDRLTCLVADFIVLFN